MLTLELYKEATTKALEYLEKVGIVLTEDEKSQMQVAEYGLNQLYSIGLQLIVYVNTDRCCAKELILLPGQTCPEHRHPSVEGEPGKEETFRCRAGEVYLYVSGEPTENPVAKAPTGREKYFTAWKEIILQPGQQYTLQPDTLHWFQAGDAGAVVSEFSTKSMDEFDIYTDPDIDSKQKRNL